jgi:hypothetical protein
MKPVFVTPYTFEWIEPFNHSTVGESMTIPDEAYSIEELFDRLDRGLSLGSPAPSMYDEEFESIDDYTSSDVPEPDEFYDPSMRKIDRLTYVSNLVNDHEENENISTKKKQKGTSNFGHSTKDSDELFDSQRSSGGDSESQGSSSVNES